MKDIQKVSIITVCLNCSMHIRKAIESVISQTYPLIEYVIIDGASTDGTVEIIEKYRDRIAHFISEPDTGLYNAMNKGIGAATGDILFFLNADDYFADENVVADVADVFSKSPDIDIVFGNQIFGFGGRSAIKKQSFKISRRQLAGMTIQHQTIFAKKRVFELTGYFSEGYKIVSDYDWIIRAFLVRKCKYLYIDREISVMSTNGKSWVTNFEKERVRAMKKYFSNYEIWRYRMIPYKIARLKQFIRALL